MRDTQLMGAGWEVNTEMGVARLLPDGEWMPVAQARIQAGLDRAPAQPKRITITSLDLGSNTIKLEGFGGIAVDGAPTVKATLRLSNGATAPFEAPLTADERTDLDRLLASIAERLDRESRL